MMEARIETTATIAADPEALFRFVTTAGNWPRWHPSSVAVRTEAAGPAGIGASIEEDFVVAGRSGTAIWTVTESSPPTRWAIEGKIVGANAGGTVEYELQPDPAGTHFRRVFRYPVPWKYAVLDRLAIRPRVRAESAEALRRLTALLATPVEQYPPHTPRPSDRPSA